MADDPPADDAPPARLTPAQRQQLKREEKLADLQGQIDSGALTVRQLTPEEAAEQEKLRAQRPPPRKR